MPVGALIAGGLGAAGAVGSSLIGASAAKSASAAQTAMGQQALAQQQQFGQQGIDMLKSMFGVAQGTVSPVIGQALGFANGQGNALLGGGGDLRAAGRGLIDPATKTLNALLTPGASMTNTLSQLPGFQFAQDWGQKAVQNMGTTMGLGGNTLKAGADYATGVAQQGYGNYVQQLLAAIGGGTNILNSGNSLSSIGGNLIGSGLSSASGSANALAGAAINAGNSGFQNLNQLGSTVGNTLTGIGQSQGAGILGTANAYMGGLQGATGALGGGIGNSLLYSKLLGGSQNEAFGGQSPFSGGIYGGNSNNPLPGLSASDYGPGF